MTVEAIPRIAVQQRDPRPAQKGHELAVAGVRGMGNPAAVIRPIPPHPEPLRPVGDPRAAPSRNAAAQRRAMQAAMANAVRALRSPGGRRDPGHRPTAHRH